jgi:hypothetical protein
VSWLGLYIHNVAELPHQTPLSPESAIPAAILLPLVGLWFSRYKRTATWLLQGWGWLHLVGGGVVSMLLIPFLPDASARTLHHYIFHAVYGLAQLPLIAATRQWT